MNENKTVLKRLTEKKINERFSIFFKSLVPVVIIHTAQNYQKKWSKISGLEANIFGLEMMTESGLDYFYFEIPLATSLANLPSRFSLSGQKQLYNFIVLELRYITLDTT